MREEIEEDKPSIKVHGSKLFKQKNNRLDVQHFPLPDACLLSPKVAHIAAGHMAALLDIDCSS